MELVDSIFRIMHSLKGGGGMFGFDNISNYTHRLENMYDLVRQKKLKVTREMLDITFESADHITSMLNDDGSKTDERDLVAELTKEMLEAADKLEFEKAAYLRDQIAKIKGKNADNTKKKRKIKKK